MWNDDLKDHRRAGQYLVGGTALAAHLADPYREVPPASLNVTVFRCVNCSRPATAEPDWPVPVREIALPCAGRLQPEHLLKAFEAGADAVCIITCAGEDCRYLEGSRRAERRVDYVRRLLDEIGLGSERLLVFHLAASPKALATLGRGPNGPSPGSQLNQEEIASRLAEIRDAVAAGIGALQPSPLRQNRATV